MVKSYKLDTYNAQEILNNQLKLINAFSNKNLPIIVVAGDQKEKSNPVMLRLWGDENKKHKKTGLTNLNELVPEIADAKYSKLILKSEYDAFFRTDLEKYCEENNIDELYFKQK